MKVPANNVKLPTVYTLFRIDDSIWRCVYSNSREFEGVVLCDYLSALGVDIPECIEYCLAHTPDYSKRIKFRHYGGNITIYVSPSN